MADQGQRAGARPAGWKKDPSGRHYGRWWDGARWTDHVISAEKVQGVDPLPPRPEPRLFPDSQQPPQPPQPAVRYRGPAPTAPGWVPPQPTITETADERRQGAYLILGGAGAAGVGCFLPWAKLTAPFIGTISKAGIEGDGMVFLILTGAIVAVTFSFTQKVPGSVGVRRWTIAAMLVLLGLGTVIDFVDIASRFSDIQADDDFPVSVSIGAGLWLVGIGVIVATVGWVRMPWAAMNPGRDNAPAAGP